DDRHSQRAQLAHQRVVERLERAPEIGAVAKHGGGAIGKVLSGAEAASGSGQHDCAAILVSLAGLKRCTKFGVLRLVERIEPIRSVEGDDGVAISALVDDWRFRHDLSPQEYGLFASAYSNTMLGVEALAAACSSRMRSSTLAAMSR